MLIPRILISASGGGAGKTLLSLGLCRAFVQQGRKVKACKKGPDYIDAAWLARAAAGVCTNLDPFFLPPDRLRALVRHVWCTPPHAPHRQKAGAEGLLPRNAGFARAGAAADSATGSTVHSAAGSATTVNARADAVTSFDTHFAAGSASFSVHAVPAAVSGENGLKTDSLYDVLLIEGNRGLFDGRDVAGSCSSAELAKALDTPVILSLDITKMTRTAAALVAGLAHFDPAVRIGGVVLNQCASPRHERIVRQSIETYTDIPVLGIMPRFAVNPLPERHMGLSDAHSTAAGEAVLEELARTVTAHVDMQAVFALAASSPPLPEEKPFWPEDAVWGHGAFGAQDNVTAGAITVHSAVTEGKSNAAHKKARADAAHGAQKGSPNAGHAAHAAQMTDTDATPHADNAGQKADQDAGQPIPAPVRIGYVHDAVLWFYYQENLDALTRAGAELVPLSLLKGAPWPQDLHGLYLGGGFPEEWGEALRACPHLARIAAFSTANMPIYAECGGFMLLAEGIERDGIIYPMAGIFPVRAHFYPKPQGLGYVEARVVGTNPFHPQGSVLRGHEFHYSRCEGDEKALQCCTLALHPGTGMGQGHDGLLTRQTFAAYTHLYAPAMPHWAAHFVRAAARYRDGQTAAASPKS